jgi:hypothetical protein
VFCGFRHGASPLPSAGIFLAGPTLTSGIRATCRQQPVRWRRSTLTELSQPESFAESRPGFVVPVFSRLGRLAIAVAIAIAIKGGASRSRSWIPGLFTFRQGQPAPPASPRLEALRALWSSSSSGNPRPQPRRGRLPPRGSRKCGRRSARKLGPRWNDCRTFGRNRHASWRFRHGVCAVRGLSSGCISATQERHSHDPLDRIRHSRRSMAVRSSSPARAAWVSKTRLHSPAPAAR